MGLPEVTRLDFPVPAVGRGICSSLCSLWVWFLRFLNMVASPPQRTATATGYELRLVFSVCRNVLGHCVNETSAAVPVVV